MYKYREPVDLLYIDNIFKVCESQNIIAKEVIVYCFEISGVINLHFFLPAVNRRLFFNAFI